MSLKPWYKVITPREDLREGKPLDAAEFAVHLDKVREKKAPEDYQKPERFFERTYLTKNLTALASEVVRRLSGEQTETSAVFNMATQFGGGKTHALTLLYHLAKGGPQAKSWQGVNQILMKAQVPDVPPSETAVFVGTEFDSLTGRGGDDGTPLRKTPWGEIAFQLGGAKGFALVAEHDKQLTSPAGDVIKKILPSNKPCLILMDELMNYVSRNRKSGLSAQLYNFLQNLSEIARGEHNVVLAVSIPASELEMTSDDQADYSRFKKLLDRLGKAVIMAAEAETSEIIRRRLFEWGGLPKDGRETAASYADWVLTNHKQLPSWFPADQAKEMFEVTYPFHPTAISVFERKWQQLPRFQQTRGILRLLALWVSKAYQDGFKGAHRDPVIGLGTAPLDDPFFRAAAFEQLGESRLEGAVTTDICGKSDSHAVRLDKEADEHIKKARLHRKVATTIFFESNGGQSREEATVPEIRLSVGEPDLDIGNVETVLETLSASCYYLSPDRNRYKFSMSPNLNKLLADRRAIIPDTKIDERVRNEIQKVFALGRGIEFIPFPEKSNLVSDRPALTIAIVSPGHPFQDTKTLPWIETMTRECGSSSRTFKSALIWVVPETDTLMKEEARKVLAWENIQNEEGELRLDDVQKRQLAENLKLSQRDLKETIWRSYKIIALLGKDNKMKIIDLGLIHSSSAESITGFILNRLRQDGDIEDGISPSFLVRNWAPAFKEWSTKAIRDAFFASPQFPRLLNPEAVKETIARGISNGVFGYVGKSPSGQYEPFVFAAPFAAHEVEISDEVFIIQKETAEAYEKKQTAPKEPPIENDGKFVASPPVTLPGKPAPPISVPTDPGIKPVIDKPAKLTWSGQISVQKWTTFYMKVLTRFAAEKDVKLTLNVEVLSENGISSQKVEDTRIALRELGLDDGLEVK